MKKALIVFGIAFAAITLNSCTCECVGPNDNSGNKVCKTDYEAVYGAGSWSNYESTAKAAGWTCK